MFLDEALFQDMVHIDDFPLLGNSQVTLGILSSCVAYQPFYLTRIVENSSSTSYISLVIGIGKQLGYFHKGELLFLLILVWLFVVWSFS